MKIQNKPSFERFLKESWDHDFSTWDWSYLAGRMVESPLSWDYHKMVFDQSRSVHSFLDMGTGGGEFLATLRPFPPLTYATESYPLNFEVARKFLEPLGVKVIGLREEEPLPFEDGSLELVINRHASYSTSELHRILKPGCRFITQQVGGRNDIRFKKMKMKMNPMRIESNVVANWNLY